MNQGTLNLKLKEYTPVENRLRATACNERPQQRLENFGVSALSDTELLAILLRSGTHGNDILTLSGRLIAEAGSIARLASWQEPDFRRMKGIGRVKAQQLVAIMEIPLADLVGDEAARARGEHVGSDPGRLGGGTTREKCRSNKEY